MQNILVAIDGSEHANQAIELASVLSTALNAKLHIVHVRDQGTLSDDEIQLLSTEFSREVDKYINDNDMTNIPGSSSNYVKKHQEFAGIFHNIIGDYTMKSAVLLSKKNGVSDPDTHLRTGDAAENILSVARMINTDLIVIGNRGRNKIESMLMGSVSTKVNQAAKVPVLIVK